ncbi:MAG: hypothetical protein KIT84_25050 [Labilithrix sp.]|nr:hypothetical protein [Labilithrix sp.]MCW5814319.1 hypothetical protein [Labilithrix sp.]
MIPKQPPKKTATRPGLGMDPEDRIPRLESAELEKARAAALKPEAITPPPSSRARVPREDEDEPPRSQRYGQRTTASWGDEAPSGPRSRKPLAVDSVGPAATRIARGTRQTAPKVVATKSMISNAPLDSRTAFILSLVDGSSDVPAIVDAAGMPADEVIGVLARLARLGLISVP